jgi:hypothetical protein
MTELIPAGTGVPISESVVVNKIRFGLCCPRAPILFGEPATIPRYIGGNPPCRSLIFHPHGYYMKKEEIPDAMRLLFEDLVSTMYLGDYWYVGRRGTLFVHWTEAEPWNLYVHSNRNAGKTIRQAMYD